MVDRLLRSLVLWLLCVVSAQAVVVRDDLQVAVTLTQVPQRIVSLLPSLTETVCALGQCQRLVGVDRYSNWPESVAKLPRLGGGIDPQIESVVALAPDLVLMATSARGADRLRALGLKVLSLEPKSHADMQRVITTLGQVLGLANADAQRVWHDMQSGVEAAAQSVPASARGARVYFEVSPAPHAASEASFIGETLTRLGARNVVPAMLGPFPQLNPEFVVRAQPDVIMVGDSNWALMRNRPGWASLSALQQHRVCTFTPEQSDVLVRPGPRMAEAAALMAQCLRNVRAVP
jgi:iron complex transport system substrate-binding protein